MNRAVRPLNRQLHQVFRVVSSSQSITESFVQDVDCGSRGDFSGFRTTHAIGDREKSTCGIGQKRIFVHRPLFTEAPVANRSDLDFVCWSRSTHCTASNSMFSSGVRRACLIATASFAFRCEKAINIPSIAKLVIKLNPP